MNRRGFDQALRRCMQADRHALRREWQQLQARRDSGKAVGDATARLEQKLAASAARVERRAGTLPTIEYPEELPISARREEIAAAVRDHQVVIVCGETGSGKTTQLPKICLDTALGLGRGITGLIGHTQPRRIAARSVAERIAQELKSPLGKHAGYKIRFNDRIDESAYIKLMTDGILLNEAQRDRFLDQYDTIIIDEAHERSLNIDFLLGVLKTLLPKRPDLKLIVTSATIDPERFARFFRDAPIVQVSGRSYPVEVRYRRPDDGIDLPEAIGRAIEELPKSGDVLTFLPGERDIRDATKSLSKRLPAGTEVLPLFGRLSADDQQRIFRPGGRRRVVLATNVAETSITVPGIRYVVDTGLARISRYSYRSKVQRLPIEPVSQASANQRAGRCGRVAPGVCIRLYDEEDFNARDEFTAPEIQRTNLASVILQMRYLRLGDVEDFPFIDPPDGRFVRDGLRLLEQLGAIDRHQKLTNTGKAMARLPVDPRIARMLVAANEFGCLREMRIIASGLSIQDPRERPLEKQQAADEKHARFVDKRSDFMALLNLWEHFQTLRKELRGNALRRECRESFLNWLRLREWQDVHQQLSGQCEALKFSLNDSPAEYAAIHRALLTGLLDHLGSRTEKSEYRAARGGRFHLFPGSGLAGKPPPWIVAAELVETGRAYARTCAAIEPEWVEQAAPQQVKRQWFEPSWDAKRGEVVVREQVSLFGLVLIADRKTRAVDPVQARDVLIREALVPGILRTRGSFLAHNLKLLTQGQQLEAKARRRDFVVDERKLIAFYDQRLPDEVVDQRSFEQWRRQAERARPTLLHMTEADLLDKPADSVSADDFPDQLVLNGVPIKLEYHFDPASADDGVTATIPVALLNQVDANRFDWQVAGLRQEKAVALIRSLPKALRRNFVPAPEFARAALDAAEPYRRPLAEALAMELERMTGISVPETAWDVSALPLHLRMNFRVIAEDGQRVAEGRNLDALRAKHGAQAQKAFAEFPKTEWDRDGLLSWDFGDLPDSVTVKHRGLTMQGIPALVDKVNSVAMRLVDAPEKAQAAHHDGVRRLLELALAKEIRYLEKNLPVLNELASAAQQLPSPPAWLADALPQAVAAGEQVREALRGDLIHQAVERLFLSPPIPREQHDYETRLNQGRGEFVAAVTETAEQARRCLQARRQIIKQLDGNHPLAWLESIRDMREQLDHLIYRGFVSTTSPTQLAQLPRYLQALEQRMIKLRENPGADGPRLRDVVRHWQRYAEKAQTNAKRGIHDPALIRYRWAIEEYRVSLFAQQLKTAYPISAKRLDALWAELS